MVLTFISVCLWLLSCTTKVPLSQILVANLVIISFKFFVVLHSTSSTTLPNTLLLLRICDKLAKTSLIPKDK